ncbi:hypothetical protein TNCV_1894061 [Trichonephila clavipes]|nr:hypothetical protein TNCV_1894061 [Trichonephila clavipes]
MWQFLVRIRIHPTALGNGSQMSISSRNGVHKPFVPCHPCQKTRGHILMAVKGKGRTPKLHWSKPKLLTLKWSRYRLCHWIEAQNCDNVSNIPCVLTKLDVKMQSKY